MQQKIINYHKDEENHWVAELECHHNHHIRHKPPFIVREWTTTKTGRDSMLGEKLNCKKCDDGAELDF
jgi:hypothetical protein